MVLVYFTFRERNISGKIDFKTKSITREKEGGAFCKDQFSRKTYCQCFCAS